MNYELGCRLPLEEWLWLNQVGAFEDPSLRRYVSPFPPPELMHNVSGLRSERDFASHGAYIFQALSRASQRPLAEYDSLLDFGCGCGRLARMFKGHPRGILGCDIDQRHVQWMQANLDFVKASLSRVRPPLPYADAQFDGIIGISVFTHLNEASQDEFLEELRRVSKPDAVLFLTVHGQRALERSLSEQKIRDMIAVPEQPFCRAQRDFAAGRHAFILQHGHLTQTGTRPIHRWRRLLLGRRVLVPESFEYGITFLPEDYLRRHWSRWFEIADYRHGAITDFQDIVVLRPRT